MFYICQALFTNKTVYSSSYNLFYMVESSWCPRSPIMPSFSFRLTLPSLVTQRDFLVIGLLYDRRQMLALHSDGYCRPNGCARSRSIDCLLYPLFCLLSFYLYLSSTVLDISAHPWRLLDDEPSTACPIAALHRSYLFCKILSFLTAFSFAIFTLSFHFLVYLCHTLPLI